MALTEKKTWKKGSKRAQIFHALRADENCSVKAAAAAAGLSLRQGWNVDRVRKIGEDIRYHNIARRSIKAIAQGQLIGALTEIRDSSVVAACNTILDRTEPKTQHISSNSMSITISDATLAKLMALRDVPQCIDEGPDIPQIDPLHTDNLIPVVLAESGGDVPDEVLSPVLAGYHIPEGYGNEDV